jgi:hypothetical protein
MGTRVRTLSRERCLTIEMRWSLAVVAAFVVVWTIAPAGRRRGVELVVDLGALQVVVKT